MDAMSLEEEYDDQASALYRKHAGRVQGFLIGMGCDRGLAEEITDDAFLAARRRWAQVRNLDDLAQIVTDRRQFRNRTPS
jgi:predicted RNA polymerase sigma factor